MESMTKDHQANLDKANKAISDSIALCTKVTAKVEKLLTDALDFMTNLKTSAESNTLKVNEAIVGLNTTLQKEKEALIEVRTSLQKYNIEFQASISSKMTKLADDLAAENNITDQLAVHTTVVKVSSGKLAYANKEIKELQSERAIVKSVVGDVKALLSNILDSHEPILKIFIQRNLVDKFPPARSMLN